LGGWAGGWVGGVAGPHAWTERGGEGGRKEGVRARRFRARRACLLLSFLPLPFPLYPSGQRTLKTVLLVAARGPAGGRGRGQGKRGKSAPTRSTAGVDASGRSLPLFRPRPRTRPPTVWQVRPALTYKDNENTVSSLREGKRWKGAEGACKKKKKRGGGAMGGAPPPGGPSAFACRGRGASAPHPPSRGRSEGRLRGRRAGARAQGKEGLTACEVPGETRKVENKTVLLALTLGTAPRALFRVFFRARADQAPLPRSPPSILSLRWPRPTSFLCWR